MVQVLQGSKNDGVTHLSDFYTFIEYVINRSLLTDKEKGYIWYLFICNNFSLIDSKPYSSIELGLYKNFYKDHGYTEQEFIEEIEEFLLQKKLEYDDKDLTYIDKFIKSILLDEEEKRKAKIKEYKIVRMCFADPTEDNMDLLSDSLFRLGVSLESIHLLNEYLMTRNECEQNSLSSYTYIPYQSKSLKKTVSLTKKEEKKLYHEMGKVLRDVREREITISLEVYQDYAQKAYKVGEDEYNFGLNLARLFAVLEKDASYYQFIYSKALTMVEQNMDIYGLLEDIKAYYGEIMVTPNDEEYACGKELILDAFEELRKIVSKNYSYERVLAKKQVENSNIESK